jgi:two-component system nitrogen regulation response regulator GlnG
MKLLVIDDEPGVRYSFQRIFAGSGPNLLPEGGDLTVTSAASGAEGLQRARAERPDVVVLDLQLPDQSGLEVFAALRALDPHLPVIFITAHGTTETAIEAMKQGAFDYLVKPIDLARVSQLLARAFEAARLMRVPARLAPDEPGEDDSTGDRIVGRSAAVQEMCKAIGRLAPQEVNVLIQGESGSGKELVARAIYQHSKRASKPFLAINCAALPEALLESELFGHEQGAFTGASRRRVGKFEQCNGGTLLLDEVGELPLPSQAKLLRVLQEQSFERVGGNETLRTQVRILAATNKDLEREVREGRFRTDLYYRLKVVTIHVPALRDHPEDVPVLAEHFLARFNRETGLHIHSLAPQTLEALQGYGWPGNVRELQGAIKQAMLQATGSVLLPEFLPPGISAPGVSEHARSASAGEDPGLTPWLEALIEAALEQAPGAVHSHVIDAVERVLFARVLGHTHGHQAQAAQLLGLNRATLRARLRALGLSIDKLPVDHSGE